MALFKLHRCSLSWLVILESCLLIFLASSFSCNDYSGGEYPTDFCISNACGSYCAGQANPESCMDSHYLSPGFCTKGSVDEKCQSVVGVQPEWTQWCQTTACTIARNACLIKGSATCPTMQVWILDHFQMFCKATEAIETTRRTDPTPSNSSTPTRCWARTSWLPGSQCQLCPESFGLYCPAFGWTICYYSKIDCETHPADSTPAPTNPCWAKTSWSASATCALCSHPQGDLCPEFHWTKCYPTQKACQGTGECWAARGWNDPTCTLCPNPQGNQCPAFHWTTCFKTKADCIDGSSGGANCKNANCRANTLGLNRPTFKGPSCYNSQYGKQFGPHWVPTGKTRFEYYVKNVTELYKVVQTTNDNLPWLKNLWHPSWNLVGCDAAAAVYENIVCAIEILTVLGKTFEGPASGSPGYKITDFLNTGDKQADLRELTVFISQSWKEVARMQVWEEQPTTAYRDCTIYPCGKSLYYQGRGPVQLSWNYNYGPFSEWFYGDKFVLLDNPDQVDPEGPMGYIAYFWFWNTPRQFTSGKPISGTIRMRDAIIHWTDNKMNGIYRDGKDYDSVAGLGLSTNVVNGGVECGGGDSELWRIVYFLTAGARLGLTLPNVNDAAACRNDKYCNGVFSGCTASAKGATCQPITDSCGPRYVTGWTTRLCQPR